MSDNDDEIVHAFLEESRENLDQLDRALVSLEENPTDPALLAQVFRTIHTIKGTCGFLGYRRLESLTHAGENLLGALRAGELSLDATIVTSLLQLVDSVRATLGRIDASGDEGDDDHAAAIAELNNLMSHQVTDAGHASPDPAREIASNDPASAEPTATETSVRVDVAVLDKLMDLMGELVLARAQIAELVTEEQDGPLTLPYRKLRLVTTELQESVMRARLQTIGTVTGKFHRIGRDLAAATGKQVRVEIEGEEVGVDKAVNEALRDPLLHLVRNAVDHGIEPPDERRASGKPPEGRLRIRAVHEGGRVQVEVSDDGRGVDAQRLVERAVEAGMVTADEAGELSPHDALGLMFRAGLSTSEQITSISGRGVGMDVVRASLERVGGSINVSTNPGHGTTFHISVPLTLSITPVLVAWSGGARYAIPQVDAQEILRLDAEQIAESVHEVGAARIQRLRGELLPLIDLAEQLRVATDSHDDELIVVVIETHGRRFGLVVDAVGETTEAVVKPLTLATRSIPLFAGVTILADGRPLLILDVSVLASRAGIVTAPDEETPDVPEAGVTDSTSLLLATGADGSRVAVRLPVVHRLEQFRADAIERSGTIDLVPYRGRLLPLLRVDDMWSGGETPGRVGTDSDRVQAVVCDSSVGPIGVVVERIEDIVPEPDIPAQPPTRRGVLASLVVAERITDLLDLEALIADAGFGKKTA